MEEKKAGRPPKYKSVAAMEEKIEEYFESCERTPYLTPEGKPLTDKYGHVCYKPARPPTITGLALALGFTSRQALLNYQGKDKFVDAVTRAKARVEMYTEERLFDKDGANGAKFSLANNFEGWKAKSRVEAELKADLNSEKNIKIELVDE